MPPENKAIPVMWHCSSIAVCPWPHHLVMAPTLRELSQLTEHLESREHYTSFG